MEALVDVTVNRWFPPEFVATKAPVLDKIRGMIRTTPYDGFAGCAYALSDYDTQPGLGGIKNPMLCICGTKDATYPGIEAINAAVPGSKLVNLEGAGHISNVEQPDNSRRRSGISSRADATSVKRSFRSARESRAPESI